MLCIFSVPSPCSPVALPPVADLMNADLLVNNVRRCHARKAIRSFSCIDTQKLFEGGACGPLGVYRTPGFAKIAQLDGSAVLDDLRAPPGKRLDAPKGDRKGQYSIRVNDQWRVCFLWTAEGAFDVEIVAYH
jgi:proteic killer suppression protein